MQICINKNIDDKAIAFCKLIQKGGSSDDTDPFSVRELALYHLNAKGPITKQSAPFALKEIHKYLLEEFSDFIKYTIYFDDYREEEIPQSVLKELFLTGKFKNSSGYFSIHDQGRVELLLNYYSDFFQGKCFAYTINNMISVRHCWSSHLLVFNQHHIGLFTFFSYD